MYASRISSLAINFGMMGWDEEVFASSYNVFGMNGAFLKCRCGFRWLKGATQIALRLKERVVRGEDRASRR